MWGLSRAIDCFTRALSITFFVLFDVGLQDTTYLYVVALWEASYIENKRFDLDTVRVVNRSPTPILKSNDVLGQSDDIWGARGPYFRPILGVPGVRAGLKKHVFSLLKRPPRASQLSP